MAWIHRLPTTWIDDIVTRRGGHEATQGVLDIFSHRFMTQFYRIWRKYSYPATFEAGDSDAISQSLLGLVGLGVLHLPGRIEAELHDGELVRFGTEFMPEGKVLLRHQKQQRILPS